MVRQFTSQVHQQVARQMRGKLFTEPPLWYQAVLDHPPLTLPSKAPPMRTAYDQKATPRGKPSPFSTRPKPIYYLEDYVRRRFFTDHPFEAFRPATLIEGERIEDPHAISGEKWTRLGQRGRNPIPEDAILFAINLYQYHSFTLSDAYGQAVAQFRALRAEHHIANNIAAMEAEQLGSTFGTSAIEEAFERSKESLASWDRKEERDQGDIVAQKRWKSIVDRNHGAQQWSEGREYVRLWQEGVRPNYMPALTKPVDTPSLADSPDPMHISGGPRK